MVIFGFLFSIILVNLLELGEMFMFFFVLMFFLFVVVLVLRVFVLFVLDRLGVGFVGVFFFLFRFCLRFCLIGFDVFLFFFFFDI